MYLSGLLLLVLAIYLLAGYLLAKARYMKSWIGSVAVFSLGIILIVLGILIRL